LNQSVIVIIFDLAQSDPIKRRALYKTWVKDGNMGTGTVKMQKSISFCCEITIGEKQQGNFG
jgi:hypothetical protein